ncbi:MFS transporter [Ornithinibacillus halophilus]|uniref:Predicted arabinose efflux permease, MFS family n=1 Tax=Ornithinibacillus halophilus TaxID=930117 RepID=A0A1M5L3Y5_9BACI|nr:MFS transporter [Ornithinibacillus halophilus]SHG59814.1 Predicted arabinose efflux permease, MFS family [Ornithinibacillus halophilus]
MSVFFKEWSVQFKTYNKNIKLAIIANLFSQIGLGMFMVIYNFYIRELGLSQSVNGEVIALQALATAIILVPAGIMSDRFGRKKIMLFGVLFSGLILVTRSIVEAEFLLLAAGFATGLFVAFLQVSTIPWLAENSTPKQRVHLFSLHAAIMTGAQVIGSLIGGTLTDLFAMVTSDLLSIRYTLIIGGVFYLLAFVPLLKMTEVRQQKEKTKEKVNLIKFFKNNKSGFKIIALFAFAQLLIGFGSGLVIPYLNLYFADRFMASNSVIGLIISLGQGATAIAMFIGPFVVKKVGEVRAVVFLQLSSLPFLLLTAYTQNLWLAAIGFLFRQALMNAGNPIQASLVMSKVDDSMKGLANSVNQMVFQLGWAFMGPVSTGIVLAYGSYWGYANVFSITAGLYLVGSLYFFFVFRSLKTSDE